MIYDYKCSKCNFIQEVIHGINEYPKIKCEQCQNNMIRMITGGTGFILKGDGWTTSNSKFKDSMINKNKKTEKKANDHVKSVNTLEDIQ